MNLQVQSPRTLTTGPQLAVGPEVKFVTLVGQTTKIMNIITIAAGAAASPDGDGSLPSVKILFLFSLLRGFRKQVIH